MYEEKLELVGIYQHETKIYLLGKIEFEMCSGGGHECRQIQPGSQDMLKDVQNGLLAHPV